MINLDKARYTNLSPFLTWVKPISQAVVSGAKLPNGYGYHPSDSAKDFYFTKYEISRQAAIIGWTKFLDAELAKIEAGQSPEIDDDSNLEIGKFIRNGVQTLAWCNPPQELIDRSVPYLAQAMFNLHNPKLAKWGSVARTWSGWSLSNPWNNYHYSFISATIWWALYTQDTVWMAKARDMLAKLNESRANAIGGGAMEGTGYGRANAGSYGVARLWEEFTGERHLHLERYAAEDIDYLCNAVWPTGTNMFAPGDHSNGSPHVLAEGDRDWVYAAANLTRDPVAKAKAAWLLTRMKVTVNANAGYLRYNKSIPITEAPIAQTALTHRAETVGHYFWRSDWSEDADVLMITAGPNIESHDAHDQGSIWLFSGRQLILGSQNMWTHSGIRQDTQYQNTVVFEHAGEFLKQVRSAAGRVIPQWVDDNNLVVDMGPCIPSIIKAAGTSWVREYRISGKVITVVDKLTFPSQVKAYRALNTPILPQIIGGNTVLGPVTISGSAPVIDWKTQTLPQSNDYHKAGYGMRIPLVPGINTHTIVCPVGFNSSPAEEEDEEVIRELQAQIDALKVSAASLSQQITAQELQVKTLTATNTQLSAELQTVKASLATATSTIAAKDKQIQELNAKLANTSLEAIELYKGYAGREVVALDEDREIVVVKKL